MSASVVDQPRLSRTAPWARSGPTPIAASTCDGWTLPDEQAEPGGYRDTRRDRSRSRRFRPSAPGTVNRVVFGSRGTPRRKHDHPRRFAAGRSPAARAAPAAARHRASSAAMAAFAAAPKPAIPATFSVPARRPSSCPPPRSSGSSPCTPSATTSAPTPLGPPILCAESVTRSARSALISNGIFPSAWIASTCSRPPASCTMSATSRDRLNRAGLVVGQHHRHQRRRPVGQQRAADGRGRPRRRR